MGNIERKTTNNKLWSFIIGCIIANSYVWLPNIAAAAPVPEVLHPHPVFVVDFYSSLITVLAAISLSITMILFMSNALKLCISEHIMWVVLPTLIFIGFTLTAAQVLIVPILTTAIPTLAVITASYLFKKRNKLRLDKI